MEWIQALASADAAESAALLRAIQMLMTCLPGTSGGTLLSAPCQNALTIAEPVISASVPALLQRASSAPAEQTDDQSSQGRRRAAAVAAHFVRWATEKCPTSSLARSLNSRSRGGQSPTTKLFLIAVAESASSDVVAHLYGELLREDEWRAAAAYVSAVAESGPASAIQLLRLFGRECERHVFSVGREGGESHVHAAMRACMPTLIRAASGSFDSVTGALVPPCYGVQSLVQQLGHWPALDAEMHAVWREESARVSWMGELPYHPAMCGNV